MDERIFRALRARYGIKSLSKENNVAAEGIVLVKSRDCFQRWVAVILRIGRDRLDRTPLYMCILLSSVVIELKTAPGEDLKMI